MEKLFIKPIILLLVLSLQVFSQEEQGKAILEKIKNYEDRLLKLDTRDNVLFLHYTSKVTDWENAVVKSEVKIYKSKDQTNFFSDQANIYQDKTDMFLVLHDQKIILWNNAPKNIDSIGLSDEYAKLKSMFFNECKIVSCNSDENTGISTLVLNAPESKSGVLFIKNITYKYDLKNDRILSIDVDFKKEYKIKKMVVIYHDFNLDFQYKLKSTAIKNVLDKNNLPFGKFIGFKLINNKD